MGVYEHTTSAMGTVIAIQVVSDTIDDRPSADIIDRVADALAWFRHVERACSRFDSTSELRQLCTHVGEAVHVSDVLYEALHFACAVAAATDGAFDPTVGAALESRGFDLSWISGERARASTGDTPHASWRDIRFNGETRTVTIAKPMVLDLGAIAKGLAVDLAAQSLADLSNFAINAGGDVWCAGSNASGEPWAIGIQDPHDVRNVHTRLRVSNVAVCTSGNYARTSELSHASHADRARVDDADRLHVIDPRTRRSVHALESATVIAPSAMVADALATAAFVLGPQFGLELLHAHDVDGLLIAADGTSVETRGMHAWYATNDRVVA